MAGAVSKEKSLKNVVGKGEPILLFPGFACPGDLWKEATRELAKRYECHAFTFAGFGGVPSIERSWLPKIKEAVVEYVHQRKLEHAIIIGHSLGGTLGLWLAATEPTLFKKVIVVDTLPCMGVVMMLNTEKQAQVVDWIMMADRQTHVYGYVDMLKLDLREDLAKIKIPVVVLAATHLDKSMIGKTYNE